MIANTLSRQALAPLLMLSFFASVLPAATSYPLIAGQQPGDTIQVDAKLQIRGSLRIRVGGKDELIPLTALGVAKYQEHTLQVPAKKNHLRRSLRKYDSVIAELKVGDDNIKFELPENRRRILAFADAKSTTLFSPSGSLTRDQLDIVSFPADSLSLAGLLPNKRVDKNSRWKHSESTMNRLLGLDEVSSVNVSSQLVEVDGFDAKIKMSGSVEGAIGGAKTNIKLSAVYRYDLKNKRVTWMSLSIQEDRAVSPIAPGVKATSRIDMRLTALESSVRPIEPTDLERSITPNDKVTLLAYSPLGRQFQLHHARAWHVVSDEKHIAVLRLTHRGEILAQCNISPMTKAEAGKTPTLSQFRADIEKRLGKNFGQFVEISQGANRRGYRVYRAAALGMVSEVKIRWIYYYLADKNGNQLGLVISMDENSYKQFGDRDKNLVSQLQLFEPAEKVSAAKSVLKK